MAKPQNIKGKKAESAKVHEKNQQKEVSPPEDELKVDSSEGESESDREKSEDDSDSESDVELSDESDEEDEEEEEEIKGLQDVNKHVIIKPSRTIPKSKKDQAKKGVIYLGRIPDGFYEEEMKKYFSQFGDITRVKLSRNRKTGKSKHYGFIEFDNQAVAKIASETMNNYLLYGHLIKCYVVEDSSKYDMIFSDNKFKIIPWKSISRVRNDKPKLQDHWDKLTSKFNKNKQTRQKLLQQKGISLEYLS